MAAAGWKLADDKKSQSQKIYMNDLLDAERTCVGYYCLIIIIGGCTRSHPRHLSVLQPSNYSKYTIYYYYYYIIVVIIINTNIIISLSI